MLLVLRGVATGCEAEIRHAQDAAPAMGSGGSWSSVPERFAMAASQVPYVLGCDQARPSSCSLCGEVIGESRTALGREMKPAGWLN